MFVFNVFLFLNIFSFVFLNDFFNIFLKIDAFFMKIYVFYDSFNEHFCSFKFFFPFFRCV